MIKRKIFTNVSREISKRKDILDFLKSNLGLEQIFSLSNNLSRNRLELYKKSYFGIGNTDYYKVNLHNDNQLFIKMEYTNTMGNTHYSRYWIIQLYLCELFGILIPGESNIIEVTSGSSGIALAEACEILGFNVTILVPDILPENRIAPMRKKSAQIIKVPGYINECINKLREILDKNDYFPTNHSEEKSDLIIYVFSRIAVEIIEDNIKPDNLIIGMGNGTSTLAISRTLKEYSPNLEITAYRPKFEENPKDIVFGLIGANIDCRHVKLAENLIDKIEYTTGIDINIIKSHYKYDTEISNLGLSSLFGIYFAHKLSENVCGKKILTLGYDKIDRY